MKNPFVFKVSLFTGKIPLRRKILKCSLNDTCSVMLCNFHGAIVAEGIDYEDIVAP